MQVLSSTQNSKIKELCKIRDQKRARAISGSFLIEGLRLSEEAMDSEVPILGLYLTEDFHARHGAAAQVLADKAEETFLISPEIADKLADSKSPQGVFCHCALLDNEFAVDKIRSAGRFLMAHNLQDPGNLGTIIRSCEALGADGLILSGDCPDIYSPKVLRSAMGGVFRLPVYIADDVTNTILRLRDSGIRVLGAALSKEAQVLGSAPLGDGCCILIGNEGNGLPQEVTDLCTGLIRIPMTPMAESLNASAAASILLWELLKTRFH